MQIPGPTSIQTNAAPPWAYPGGGAWISPGGQSNGSVTPVAGTLYVYAFIAPATFTISNMATQLTGSPSSDSIIRVGAWAPGVGFAPGALICDSGALAVTTSGTKIFGGVSGSFNAGLNFLGFVYNVSTTPGACESCALGTFGYPYEGFSYYQTGTNPNIAQGNDGTVFTQTGVTGALPNPFAGSWVGNSNSPARPITILFRVN